MLSLYVRGFFPSTATIRRSTAGGQCHGLVPATFSVIFFMPAAMTRTILVVLHDPLQTVGDPWQRRGTHAELFIAV